MEPHTPSGSAALWGSQSWLQPAFIRRVQGGRRGFTFVELMVVVSIVVILISVAVPSYTRSLIRAKESVLKNNLFTLRGCIDSVAFDRQKAPQDLRDLVSAGCLAKIPTDPITNTPNWRTIPEDPSQAVSQSEPGIFDVRSTSDKIGLDRTPYAEW